MFLKQQVKTHGIHIPINYFWKKSWFHIFEVLQSILNMLDLYAFDFI